MIGHAGPDRANWPRQYRRCGCLITAGELSGQQVRQLVDDGRAGQDQRARCCRVTSSCCAGRVDLRPRRGFDRGPAAPRAGPAGHGANLHRWIDDRVLLVTGSAGSIGSEICRQLLQFSPAATGAGRPFGKRPVLPGAGTAAVWPPTWTSTSASADVLDADRGCEALFQHAPPRRGLPRRRLQARAADGSPSGRSGQEHRAGHPAAGRPGAKPAASRRS